MCVWSIYVTVEGRVLFDFALSWFYKSLLLFTLSKVDCRLRLGVFILSKPAIKSIILLLFTFIPHHLNTPHCSKTHPTKPAPNCRTNTITHERTMSYLHLTRTRTRDRSPSPILPLTRRDTKHSRIISLSDDEDSADDYPYSSSHRPVRQSRALTLRNQPSQLERYNIWSDRHASPAKDDEGVFERERELERSREWRYKSERSGGHHYHDQQRGLSDEECDPEERAFRLKVKASISSTRPESSHHHNHHHHSHSHSHMHNPFHHHHSHHLSIPDTFRRKDKWTAENYEERSRSRSRSRSHDRRDSFWGKGGFWGDEKCLDKEIEDETDVWKRYRKVKRTRTEEWRPLVGWRRC